MPLSKLRPSFTLIEDRLKELQAISADFCGVSGLGGGILSSKALYV